MLATEERNVQLALPIKDVPFVLLDVESTGLEAARGDRICEVALMRWQNGEVVRKFETLINPGRPISADAFRVNQIDARALLGAPRFADIAEALTHELDGAVLVAHNVPFDVHFLDTEFMLIGRPTISQIVLDTLTLARCFLLHERYNLAALARDLGFERPSHRAMSDVVALLSLFNHLLTRLSMLGVTTLGDLVRAQRGLLPGQPEPEAPPLLAEALRNGTRLRIVYQKRGVEPITREILPLELQNIGGAVRLLAYCYLRNSQRTFYLDRIVDIAVADG